MRSTYRSELPPLLGVLALFSIIGFGVMGSDWWLDEVITLRDYVIPDEFSPIFTSYPVANNHILFSALEWLWVHNVPIFGEVAMRVPLFAMALVTLLVLYLIGRRFFDRSAGLLMMLTMTMSPVFIGFFYQLRGYGLSMMLAAIATWAALHISEGNRRRGVPWLAGCMLLLPGVVPTNVLINVGLWLFLAVRTVQSGRLRRDRLMLAGLGLASVGGMAIYLPMLEQFLRVAGRTRGWDSGVMVVGHWLLAWAIHGGALAAVSLAWAIHHRKSEPTTAGRHVPLLAACTLGPLLIFALFRAPYPRALLGYLPILTVCLLAWYRPLPRQLVMLGVVAILAVGALSTRIGEKTARRQLEAGRYTVNLLYQYHTGNKELYHTVRMLASEFGESANLTLYADFHLAEPARLYWEHFNGKRIQITSLGGGPSVRNWDVEPADGPMIVLMLTHDLPDAKAGYQRITGREPIVEQVPAPSTLPIYRVIGER